MPNWYWDRHTILTKTPSIQDGISNATEYAYRKEGARFIIDVGSEMDLGYNTLATGVVFFHRFYMRHSFKDFPRYITACCCLFLAGKVEETPKKCKDIIRVAQNLLSEEKFATFGMDPKEEVMVLEKILLQTIKFDLKVQHPYSYLTKYAKCLKGDKVKLQKMVQMAWTFINDSLCTTLSIEWEPEVIAIAVMYLAGKLCQFKVTDWSFRHPRHIHWWDVYVEDLQVNVLEDICHQILDLYSPSQNPKTLVSPSVNCATANTKFTNNVITRAPATSTTTTSTTNTTATVTTAMGTVASKSAISIPFQKNLQTAKTSIHNVSQTNVSNTKKPISPWAVPMPFDTISPENARCSSAVPMVDVTKPPPSNNFSNLFQKSQNDRHYDKSENNRNYKNGSPFSNCLVNSQIFNQLMDKDQYKLSTNNQSMSFLDHMDPPYFKNKDSKSPNSLVADRHRHRSNSSRYSDNQKDYFTEYTFKRNFAKNDFPMHRHGRRNDSRKYFMD